MEQQSHTDRRNSAKREGICCNYPVSAEFQFEVRLTFQRWTVTTDKQTKSTGRHKQKLMCKQGFAGHTYNYKGLYE